MVVLLKTLPVKPNGTKPKQKENKYNVLTSMLIWFPLRWHDYTFSSTSTWSSFSCHTPMLYMSFLNVVVDNDFVNKFVKLPLNLNYWTLISLLFEARKCKRIW